jgi:hypothetical protein
MFDKITLHDFSKPLAQRKRKFTGPYYTRPRPIGRDGFGFYLQHDTRELECARHGSAFRLRLEEAGGAWRHNESDDEFQPIIARLPRGRGFLAGWTLGAGMCAELSATIHDDVSVARHAAQSEAESACDRDFFHQLEFQAEQEAEWEAERMAEEIAESRPDLAPEWV